MVALNGPQWESFGWRRQPYDAYGEPTPGVKHYHAEGPEGLGIESPQGNDYGAVVSGRPGNWEISHAEQYSGLSDVANSIADALNFMDITGADTVSFEHDERRPEIKSSDLVKELYEARPSFPRTFKTPQRAMTVAEMLIKRRDANIAMTRRPKR
jgi:hypothetical protein